MSDVKQPSLLGHEKRINELEKQVETLQVYVIAALRTQARSREAQNLANDFEAVYAKGAT